MANTMLRHWQLLAAFTWATIATVLLLRDSILSPAQADRFDGPSWSTATWVAGGLAIWNVFRWRQTQVQTRVRAVPPQPLEPHRDRQAKYEYNPELDFHRGHDDKV